MSYNTPSPTSHVSQNVSSPMSNNSHPIIQGSSSIHHTPVDVTTIHHTSSHGSISHSGNHGATHSHKHGHRSSVVGSMRSMTFVTGQNNYDSDGDDD
jgi:hypothetical protein